ncbi:unannotated protein [freshwater metagenome]|uniref:Unannotated protein n=1 Tax=freshwater metagenome TaxID=449393 RepID=A0A6J5YLV5_9ZZZZ
MGDKESGRGVNSCRGCGHEDLVNVLDLGLQPLSNGLIKIESELSATLYPLHLRVCKSCWLGQLGEFATPTEIFEDYRYLSSVSQTWISHARLYAQQCVIKLDLTPSDLIIEIASNDGYLLKEFKNLGIRVLGVEPAHNVAEIAQAQGIDTISEFMGQQVGKQIAAQYGKASLVPANNVLAHVPNMHDFLLGIRELMSDETLLSVENPSMMSMLDNVQFDTIYHEHFSYLTATSVNKAVKEVELELIDVEQLSTHGGSNRYWIAKAGVREVQPSVHNTLASEQESGIDNLETYKKFQRRSEDAIAGFKDFLVQCAANGQTVLGYGAAAKAVVLLNAADVSTDLLPAVADAGSEKQGYRIPGVDIPIIAPESMIDFAPDVVVVFPWNIAGELKSVIQSLLGTQVQIVIAIPEIQTL